MLPVYYQNILLSEKIIVSNMVVGGDQFSLCSERFDATHCETGLSWMLGVDCCFSPAEQVEHFPFAEGFEMKVTCMGSPYMLIKQFHSIIQYPIGEKEIGKTPAANRRDLLDYGMYQMIPVTVRSSNEN